MLVKAAAMVRAMVAQLQTTFLKAFGDTQSNDTVRLVVVGNLLLLSGMTPKADPIVKELTAQLDGDKIDGEQKVQVSQALACILREKGKSIPEAISKQVYTVMTNIIDERFDTLNDKVLVNCSVCLGFLSAYSSDPAQMKDLFSAYDDNKDYRMSLGIKLGILMNGSDKIPDVASLKASATDYICQVMGTHSGIEEIDGKDISKGRPDEEIFRFHGAIDTLAHIYDTYLRRYFKKSDSDMSKILFSAFSKCGILQKLNQEEDFSGMTKVYDIVPGVSEKLPIPAMGEAISAEQA